MGIELLPSDLDAAKAMLTVLENAASIEHVEEVKIMFRLDGGDWITVGYGAQAEAAVINIQPNTK